MNSMARLGPYRYWITFYICHAGREARSWLLAEDHLREAVVPWCRSEGALWAVSTLPAHGLVLRGLARSSAQVLPALLAIWRSAKLFLFGQAPIVPRKMY
jgi:urease accessory protein